MNQIQTNIINTLTTLITHPSASVVSQATNALKYLSNTQGIDSAEVDYFVYLLHIASNHELNINVRRQALLIIKNDKHYIAQSEFEKIVGLLYSVYCNCYEHPDLIKSLNWLISKIFKSNVHNMCVQNFVNHIVSQFRQPAVDQIAYLYLIEALANHHQFTLPQQKVYSLLFNEFLPMMKQLLSEQVELNRVTYLCMKIIFKSIYLSLDPQTTTLLNNINSDILRFLETEKAEMESVCDKCQKYSAAYYFYHTKKWAMKIVMRYFKRHFNVRLCDNKKSNLSLKPWYENYGCKFINYIFESITRKSIKKVKCYQYQTLSAVFDDYKYTPKAHKQKNLLLQILDQKYMKQLPYVLFPVLVLPKQHIEMIYSQNSDIFFIQTDFKIDETTAAEELWMRLYRINPKQLGEFLFEKFNSQNIQQIEISLRMLYKIKGQLNRNQQKSNKNIMSTVVKLILPAINHDNIIIRSRIMQIIYAYSEFIDPGARKSIIPIIYENLKANNIYLQSHSIEAFCAVIKSDSSLTYEYKDRLGQLIATFFKVVERNPSENILSTFSEFIQAFLEFIKPFEVQLVNKFIKLFVEYSSNLPGVDDQPDNSQKEFCASRSLNLIENMIMSFDISNISKVEEAIFEVLCLMVKQEYIDFIDDFLKILVVYLYKIPTISVKMWTFYPVVIYMSYFKKNFTKNEVIALPSLAEGQYQIFEKARKLMTELNQTHVQVINNYLYKGNQIIVNNTDIYGTNLLEILFQMIEDTQKSVDDQPEILDYCKAAYISILVNIKPLGPPLHIILSKIVQNKFKNPYQYFILGCASLYNSAVSTLHYMYQNSMLTQFLTALSNYKKYIGEVSLCILGLLSIFDLQAIPQPLFEYVPGLFASLLNAVKQDYKQFNVSFNNSGTSQQMEDQYQQCSSQMDIEMSGGLILDGEAILNPLLKINHYDRFEKAFEKIEVDYPSLYTTTIGSLDEPNKAMIKEWISKGNEQIAEQEMKEVNLLD